MTVVFPRSYWVSGRIKGSTVAQHGFPGVVFVHLKLAQHNLGKRVSTIRGECIIFPGSKGCILGELS